MKIDIKSLVENGKMAKFAYYRDNALWYQVDNFIFPVPIGDIGTATFLSEEKAITLLRWIRKYTKEIESARPVI